MGHGHHLSGLVDKLSGYTRCHRDPRHPAMHMFGVPMILRGTAVLLPRPGLDAAPHLLNPGVLALLGRGIADMAMPIWRSLGLGLLLVGRVLQLWGHAFEGRKLAFLDDIQQLLTGPFFVVAEIGFRLGRGQRRLGGLQCAALVTGPLLGGLLV
ncbi:Mpo1-like protein [Frateuria aurantia]